MSRNILRKSVVKARTGYTSNSSLYARIADGTLPAPVKISARASGWIEHEIDSVIDARILGKTEEEIRALVRNLIARRKQIIVDELTE